MSVIYGESSSLKLIEKENRVILKTRLYLNILLLILLLMLLFFPLSIFDYEAHYIFVIGYISLSVLFALSYRKSLDFDRDANKLTICRTILGFKLRRFVSFPDIKEIIVKSAKRPMVGVQLPIPIRKYELFLTLQDTKKIFVDRSSEAATILVSAHAISRITAVPLTEQS